MGKRKKIGIMTLFNCYNYGAVLQAYATFKFIKKLGCEDVEIINYENKYESKMKNTIRFIFSGNKKEILKKFIQYVVFGKNRHLKKGFKLFCGSLVKSEKKYKTIEELKKTNYDILISGSDQIWNPVIFSDLDLAYLLDFSDSAKKISISSSAGSYLFDGEYKNNFVKCLKKYDAISVRENVLKEQLQNEIDKEIFVSVDPTLLLTREDWIEYLKPINRYNERNSKYILVYIVDANLNTYDEELMVLKERLNLPIWLITPYNFKIKNIDKNIISATPNDFISLFDSADFIITNSYHGVIFSTNFRKNFIALENHKNPVRTRDYLDKIKLVDRIVKNKEDAKVINIKEMKLEYYNNLEEFVKDTKKWIGDNLNEL